MNRQWFVQPSMTFCGETWPEQFSHIRIPSSSCEVMDKTPGIRRSHLDPNKRSAKHRLTSQQARSLFQEFSKIVTPLVPPTVFVPRWLQGENDGAKSMFREYLSIQISTRILMPLCLLIRNWIYVDKLSHWHGVFAAADIGHVSAEHQRVINKSMSDGKQKCTDFHALKTYFTHQIWFKFFVKYPKWECPFKF